MSVWSLAHHLVSVFLVLAELTLLPALHFEPVLAGSPSRPPLDSSSSDELMLAACLAFLDGLIC